MLLFRDGRLNSRLVGGARFDTTGNTRDSEEWDISATTGTPRRPESVLSVPALSPFAANFLEVHAARHERPFLPSGVPYTRFSATQPNPATPLYPCLVTRDWCSSFGRLGTPRWIEAEREEALRGVSSKGGDRSTGDVVHREEVFHAFGAGPRKCPGAVNTRRCVLE